MKVNDTTAVLAAAEMLMAKIDKDGRTPSGTFDVQIRLSVYNEEKDEVENVTYGAELLEKDDGSWVLEEITIC